jgi:hypothetical protein
VAVAASDQLSQRAASTQLPRFPRLHWVLRDVVLDLEGRTADDYLEAQLRMLIAEDFDDSEEDPEVREEAGRNRVRVRRLMKLMPQRGCSMLCQPAFGETLARLSEEPYSSARPEFREQMVHTRHVRVVW